MKNTLTNYRIRWPTGDNDFITNIYFDGDYIGTVAPGATGSWNVPTGRHTVRFTNAEKDNQEPDNVTLEFKENETYPHYCILAQRRQIHLLSVPLHSLLNLRSDTG